MDESSHAVRSSNPQPVSKMITTFPEHEPSFTGVFQVEDVDTSIPYGRLVTMLRNTKQKPKLNFVQQRATQVQKEKILHLSLAKKHYGLALVDLLTKEHLVPYLTAKPKAFIRIWSLSYMPARWLPMMNLTSSHVLFARRS